MAFNTSPSNFCSSTMFSVLRAVSGCSVPRDQAARIAQDHTMVGHIRLDAAVPPYLGGGTVLVFFLSVD
jgi:hypothetical protein